MLRKCPSVYAAWPRPPARKRGGRKGKEREWEARRYAPVLCYAKCQRCRCFCPPLSFHSSSHILLFSPSKRHKHAHSAANDAYRFPSPGFCPWYGRTLTLQRATWTCRGGRAPGCCSSHRGSYVAADEGRSQEGRQLAIGERHCLKEDARRTICTSTTGARVAAGDRRSCGSLCCCRG